MTPNGAAGVPADDPRVQERRVRSQRHRNYMSRTQLHTPPDLPEGYGSFTHAHTHRSVLPLILTSLQRSKIHPVHTHTHALVLENCAAAGVIKNVS